MNEIFVTLVKIRKTLEPYQLRWCFGGSVALMIHGVKIFPNDIDIVCNDENFGRTIVALQESGLRVQVNGRAGSFVLGGTMVEVFGFNKDDQIIEVSYDGERFPVHSLESELRYYKDRAGKEKIVELIEQQMSTLKNAD